MATYTVTNVRKEWSGDRTHEHIAGVCTTGGTYYTRREVVDSIDGGSTWKTDAGGCTATIQRLTYCPAKACLATPHIKTKPDSTKLDNLENLPSC